MHETRGSARAEVRSRLREATAGLGAQDGAPDVDVEPFLDSFIEEYGGVGWGSASPPPGSAMYTIQVPGRRKDHYFAIRKEDLDLVSALLPAGGGVSAACWMGTGVPSAVVGAAIAAVLMGRKVSRNGVRLSEDQYRLLMALRVAAPCDERRLAFVCARLEGRTDGDWPVPRIEHLLTELQGMTTPGGSVINLVSRDGKWLWHPNA